jgi:hypothetical protein
VRLHKSNVYRVSVLFKLTLITLCKLWVVIGKQRLGAYGLTVEFPGNNGSLGEVPDSWQEWHFAYDVDSAHVEREETWSNSAGVLRMLPTGYALLDRSARSTVFVVPVEQSPEAFAHPHLGSTAVAVAQWSGHGTFHAGSFVYDRGVWAVLGGRQHGKSSTIAWLHRSGLGIMADDLLVTTHGVAFAGPRCLDLREGAAEYFAIGRDIGEVGSRRRWRVDLPQIEPELPLRGWVTLAWGNEIAVRRCSAEERFAQLFANRAFLLAESNPESWVELLSLPMYELRRPRDWSCIDEAMAALLDISALGR